MASPKRDPAADEADGWRLNRHCGVRPQIMAPYLGLSEAQVARRCTHLLDNVSADAERNKEALVVAYPQLRIELMLRERRRAA